jgi:hypothetical protein
MTADPFLVIVAESPAHTPRAFLTDGTQGINLHRGTWHGVLTPLHPPASSPWWIGSVRPPISRSTALQPPGP